MKSMMMSKHGDEWYGATCSTCYDKGSMSSMDVLDWYFEISNCELCAGTFRVPIPLAEVIAKQEMNNGR